MRFLIALACADYTATNGNVGKELATLMVIAVFIALLEDINQIWRWSK